MLVGTRLRGSEDIGEGVPTPNRREVGVDFENGNKRVCVRACMLACVRGCACLDR